MYALNIDKITKRILSVTYPEYANDDAVFVDELPEGDVSNYLFIDAEFVFDPLPKPTETIPVANRNITVGEYVTVNGILYKATANIPNGSAIIVGQNAEETTVEAQLYELTQKGE